MINTTKKSGTPVTRKEKLPTSNKSSSKSKVATELTSNTTSPKKEISDTRRKQLAVSPKRGEINATNSSNSSRSPRGKLGEIIAQLEHPEGATLADLMAITGWQAHSVRGMLSTLKKRLGRPLSISLTDDGLRLYRLEAR